MIETKNRIRCRICGAENLEQIIAFDRYPLSDNFLNAPDDSRECLLDYKAHVCTSCMVTQNLTDLNWGEYYTDYPYNVNHSTFMNNFMDEVVRVMYEEYQLPPNAKVIEIGSGDGAQLAKFTHKGAKVMGIEPSKPLADVANERQVETLIELFTQESAQQVKERLGMLDLAMMFYTFDHVPDPVETLKSIKTILNPETGFVLIEVHDLYEIIQRREACLLCHEHTIYPSKETIATIFDYAGLALIGINVVSDTFRRGNSLLALARPKESVSKSFSVSDATSIVTPTMLRNFSDSVDVSFQKLHRYVKEQTKAGKKIAGYGASARSISSLSIANLDQQDIRYILDQNNVLWGKYLPKSHIPIYGLDHLSKEPVDEVIVFSYGYMDEIKRSLKSFSDNGGDVVSFLSLL